MDVDEQAGSALDVRSLSVTLDQLKREEAAFVASAAERRAKALAELAAVEEALSSERRALDARVAALAAQQAGVSRVLAGQEPSTRVSLDFGGQVFCTSRAVLCATDEVLGQASMLGALPSR